MRDRGAVVIIENDKVALIKRERENSVYYVFPGGGVESEKGETPIDAAKREAIEELGVEVKINKLFSEVQFNGTQYFFLAETTNGLIGTGKGEEYTNKERNRGTYEPMWIEINELTKMDVRPKEVAEQIYQLYIK
ncbi:NUDIX hydrolase [Ornithinibacillus halotolerans]|uniref:DNA mismatch repair protein MutT n=1 Tax=Ornithinibacillus halotolerans TaxID=1274357 RepID=A0A916W2E0_9BACI|nr:NUDIX domain-containing protein [Ornithinibacillus halotolerans]GGA60727.1 DNA mismatch repair protein MutT [Ornithinibacillus halotolerans]